MSTPNLVHFGVIWCGFFAILACQIRGRAEFVSLVSFGATMVWWTPKYCFFFCHSPILVSCPKTPPKPICATVARELPSIYVAFQLI